VKSQVELLYEKRVTYKYPKPEDNSGGIDRMITPGGPNTCQTKYLSFSIASSWRTLVDSKCKPWDDRELDVLEGFKFISYFLGQLCLTAEFLMCTQTLNPWMIERFF